MGGSEEKKDHPGHRADTSRIRNKGCRPLYCDICMGTKHACKMIEISEGCSHSFCYRCVSMHVKVKILENVADIKCPGLGCGSVIEVGNCKGILKGRLLERWERLRCEAAIPETQKYYCPFKDCSGMLIVDEEAGDPVGLRECECPYCHRLFCASCRVPWHYKYTCEEFKSMNANGQGSNDVLLKELAQKEKWQLCPDCKFYVERTHGCPHMVCRCGVEFCYHCGKAWCGGTSHDSCPRC